jgi:hypothetical protein
MDIGSWEFWRAQAMATDDFFRVRLDSMIDMRHSLAVLATRMPWAPEFDTKRCKLLICIEPPPHAATTPTTFVG